MTPAVSEAVRCRGCRTANVRLRNYTARKILRERLKKYLQPNNDLKLMQGLSIKSLKHHVALQPLAIIMVGGMAFVAAYIGR